MTKKKSNHLIAVDSETGTYFHGYRKLQTQAEINAVINYASHEQAIFDIYSNLGRSLIQLTMASFMNTVGLCFGNLGQSQRLS